MSLRQRTGGTTNPNVFTSADLIIDEGLSNIDRVCQYTSASVALMRLVHVSMISDVAHDVGYDTMVDRLFPLLPKLCDDDEWVVRTKWRLKLPPCANCPSRSGQEKDTI